MSFDAAAVAAAEELSFLSFTSNDAFELGSRIRATIAAHPSGRAALVDIVTASGQRLFFATSGEGTQPDNAEWARRKRASVLRWGKSTASLNVKWPGGAVPSAYGINEADYACHGGGFPIRVKGVEPIIGTIVVSGLAQEDDHQVIVDNVEKYIQEQQAAQK
ncbi:hypothetical protein JCM10207_002952 [Rhodosporidiobolus poonsookiae]